MSNVHPKKNITILLKKFFTTPEYVFFLPAIVFGTLSAIFIPQLIANDENMHFIRSYQLSELEYSHNCSIPADIKERGFFAMYREGSPDYSFSAKKINMENDISTDCGTATTYNPLLHLPQVIGIAIAKEVLPTAGVMILFGRLMNVAMYALAVFMIIRKAKVGKWALVAIGLLPMMVHMAGSLSADVVNNVIILAFISYIFNLFTQKNTMTTKQIVVLFLMSGLLAVTKMTNLVLLLLILFLPNRVLPKLRIKKIKIPKVVVRLGVGMVCGVTACTILATWMILYGDSVATNVDVANPVAEKPYLFLKILFNTYINPNNIIDGISYADWLFRGVIGSFASFHYHLPYGVVALLLGLLVFVGLKKESKEEALVAPSIKQLSVGAVLSLILVICAMTYGLYVAWAIRTAAGPGIDFALGLQGRYFTPLLLLLLPLFILIRKYVSVEVKKEVLTGVIIFSVSVFALMFYLAQTLSFTASL